MQTRMDDINLYRGPGVRLLVEAVAVLVDVDIEAAGIACRDVRNPPDDLVEDDAPITGAEMVKRCDWMVY